MSSAQAADKLLRDFILRYATKSKSEVDRYLQSRSRAQVTKLIADLATHYFNVKNSSAMREMTTVWLAGYDYNYEKLGYNGYRQDGRGSIIQCEVKPQNCTTQKRKLNGGGSFNDYTPKRFRKDRRVNADVLFSGFVDGRLMYILKIKFQDIAPKLKQALRKKFGENEAKPGEYLRSAAVSFRDYEHKSPKIIYSAGSELQKNRTKIERRLYAFLTGES